MDIPEPLLGEPLAIAPNHLLTSASELLCQPLQAATATRGPAVFDPWSCQGMEFLCFYGGVLAFRERGLIARRGLIF